MKVRTYGALMGALLAFSAVDEAQAATCNCIPAPKHPAVHRAPARVMRRDEGAAYAQSWYDYRSSSRVGEVFVRQAPAVVAPPVQSRWQVAPNDAHIRFYRDERVIYVPSLAYPPPPPPPVYYYPPPVPMAYYPPGVQVDQEDFRGGVGYGPSAGGGGGDIGIYANSGGASDLPPNQGGEAIPYGYGPGLFNAWQSGMVPTRGGLAGH